MLKAYAAADPEVNYCQARVLGIWALYTARLSSPALQSLSSRACMPPGCVGVRAVGCGHIGCVLGLPSCLGVSAVVGYGST